MTALIAFVFLGLFSPGPNVILLTASGARFGFRATRPHLFGVAFGVGVIAFVTGLGLGTVVGAVPWLRIALMAVSSAWIAWMAWTLWNAKPTLSKQSERPFTFSEAILFQWVNPKIWAVSIAASAMLSDLSPFRLAMTLAVVFSITNLGVCLFWSSAGALLKSLLLNPDIWRIFMRCMALCLLIFSGLVFL